MAVIVARWTDVVFTVRSATVVRSRMRTISAGDRSVTQIQAAGSCCTRYIHNKSEIYKRVDRM